MKIGFTGTRTGLTYYQLATLNNFLHSVEDEIEAHHGDCVGADAQFHALLNKIQEDGKIIKIYIHPPIKETYRAFCIGDVVYEPRDYLQRNNAIVDNTDILIACPKESKEQRRGGTWYTVRYAREKSKEIFIMHPQNGTIE